MSLSPCRTVLAGSQQYGYVNCQQLPASHKWLRMAFTETRYWKGGLSREPFGGQKVKSGGRRLMKKLQGGGTITATVWQSHDNGTQRTRGAPSRALRLSPYASSPYESSPYESSPYESSPYTTVLSQIRT